MIIPYNNHKYEDRNPDVHVIILFVDLTAKHGKPVGVWCYKNVAERGMPRILGSISIPVHRKNKKTLS